MAQRLGLSWPQNTWSARQMAVLTDEWQKEPGNDLKIIYCLWLLFKLYSLLRRTGIEKNEELYLYEKLSWLILVSSIAPFFWKVCSLDMKKCKRDTMEKKSLSWLVTSTFLHVHKRNRNAVSKRGIKEMLYVPPINSPLQEILLSPFL